MKKQYVVQDAWNLYQVAVLASAKKKGSSAESVGNLGCR